MISIEAIGIALNTGVIPPVTKLNAKISSIGINLDSGSVPPKNFFKGGISVIGVSADVMGESERTSILFYKIF